MRKRARWRWLREGELSLRGGSKVKYSQLLVIKLKLDKLIIMGIETTGSVKEIRDVVVEVGQFVTNFFGKDYQKFAKKNNFA